MKGSKKSRTDLLEKKIQAAINIVKQLLDENAYLKDLAVGTLETVKLMPGYDKAIEELNYKNQFDHCIMNDNLNETLKNADHLIAEFLKK